MAEKDTTLRSVKSLSDPALNETTPEPTGGGGASREAEDALDGRERVDGPRRRGGSKSRTLPHRLTLLPLRPLNLKPRLPAGHTLKRSITLKNPFAVNGDSSKKSKVRVMAPIATSEDSATEDSLGHSRDPSPHARSQLGRKPSMRKFFNRMMSQITALPPKSRSQADHERIAELKRRFDQEGKVPGVVGIRNHGNTCFINAVLQCLSCTDILAEYLVLDQYKSDLRRKRRITHMSSFNKQSHRGEITEQLATLLKSLWSLQYDPEISIRFKSLVDKHASQYKGGSQHDAQEFLLWLLDQVHEDLNTATKKKYKSFKNVVSGERSDEVLAAEAMANYMRYNNSFVMDVFQAQFRSSLTCPTCEKQSNTFDPFLCVSLPIPQKQLLPVFVIVLYIDQSPRQVKLGLSVGVDETIGDLRQSLAKDTGIEAGQILLAEIDQLGFRRTLRDQDPVTVLKDPKVPPAPLYCLEVPHFKEANEDDGAYVVLSWVNVLKEGPIEKRFGSPYAIQVTREVLYSDLQKLLMKEMSPILHDDILISAQKVPLFKIRVVDGFDGQAYLDSQVDLPMYTETVEQALNLCSLEDGGSPAHVKLILEWDAPAKSQIISDDTDVIEEHASVKEVEKSPQEASSVSLQECFSLYTSAERLGQGNAVHCLACNRKQEVVKQMGLWSVPDVLVVHLKRFRQSSSTTNKLTTMVEFPFEGFDMGPNVSKAPPVPASDAEPSPNLPDKPPVVSPTPESGANTLKMFNVLSPWRHPKRFPIQKSGDDDYMFDLYAVCNHHGSDLQGGHYTAYCRNPTDGQWYCFDDMHTKPIREKEVVTQDAYILFYQRQSLTSNSSSASSSSSGSSNQEHWVFRMPDFSYKTKSASANGTTSSGATTNNKETSNNKKTSNNKNPSRPNLPVSKSKEPSTSSKNSSNFKRSDAKYATMPVKRTSRIINCDQDHHSDVEQGNGADDDDSEAEDEVTLTKEDDDVSRPIDRNDVD
eukprot:snap_masked-scaffold989_size72935-processed-gene-0.7 protein:Tk08552 transcript:snap_masked-scaffold989_size72935-processed-gene-0.7-mRNA-1 annotation:"ubiquitin carboxyl-terminal hydrolase 31-like"